MVYSIINLIKVCIIFGGMNEMNTIILAINYSDEPVCSSLENIQSWFDKYNVSIPVDEEYFILDDNKVNLDFMPKINTLSFGVRVEGDDDFPPLLFDFISSLKDNKTIVSLAECVEGESIHTNKCELIYEANLKRFMKEIVNSE